MLQQNMIINSYFKTMETLWIEHEYFAETYP